jgi:23S rRNA (cytidine1920-2'-O)/16S rRNA (cytidine1409-2'-O)-methyltransferase
MVPRQGRERLDELLVQRGLAASRERAQQLILAGDVTVGQRVVDKPGTQVRLDAPLALASRAPYASRAGLKLAAALDEFALDVRGLVAADVGASTGGFTDCLLQRGAARVFAIDVGYGQLAWELRQDPRVVVLDRTNARYLEHLPEPIDLVTVDVSFISLRLILPRAIGWLRQVSQAGISQRYPPTPHSTEPCHPEQSEGSQPDDAEMLRFVQHDRLEEAARASGGQVVALVKPQFEAVRERLGKGGVVRDPAVHRAVLSEVTAWASEQGMGLQGLVRSPITGPAGNVEFLAWWLPGRPGREDAAAMIDSCLAAGVT